MNSFDKLFLPEFMYVEVTSIVHKLPAKVASFFLFEIGHDAHCSYVVIVCELHQIARFECVVPLALGILTASFCSTIEWIILFYAVLTGKKANICMRYATSSGHPDCQFLLNHRVDHPVLCSPDR